MIYFFWGVNMENKELNEMIIKAYKEYLDGELLEDSITSIEQYVSTLYYDLLDDIEINKALFGIDQSIDDCDAVKMIEDYIEKVLKNK